MPLLALHGKFDPATTLVLRSLMSDQGTRIRGAQARLRAPWDPRVDRTLHQTGTDRWLDGLNAPRRLAIAAPFVLGYSGLAVAPVNDVVVGIIVAALGAWGAVALGQRQHPHTM